MTSASPQGGHSPSTAGDEIDERDTAPTATCPHCSATAPDAHYCGACGADLAHGHIDKASRRLHSYAAFPDEPVLRASVVSTLFPQLARKSLPHFRTILSVFVLVLLALAVARLEPAVIAVSALGVPLLFVSYVAEIDPVEIWFVVPSLGVLVVGAALGAGFALAFGPMVSDALAPSLSPSLTSAEVLRSALLAPVIAQLLMLVPVIVLWLRRPTQTEALDGFTVGALSALGFTAAMTLTELASRVQDGNVMPGSVLSVLASAVIRGLTVPLIAVATTGYISTTLWSRRGARPEVRGRWLASPPFPLAFSLLLLVGLGFADDAGLSDAFLLVIHLLAAILAFAVLRVGLHHVLLLEQRDVRIGERRVCPHCARLVPAMPFCPNCGVAERATALRPLPPVHGSGRFDVGGPAPDGEHDDALRARAVPTSSTATRAAVFRSASNEQVRAIRGLGTHRLLFVLLPVLAIGAGLLAVLAAVVPSPAPAACESLRCFTPFGPLPIRHGTTFTSTEGWGVVWYPARDVFNISPPTTSASTTGVGLRLDFTSAKVPAEDGELFFVGEDAHGMTSSQLVAALQQANVPNATPDYVLPGATVGYQVGYGEAFETTPNSFEGDGLTYEVVIACAVVNGYGVCAYAVGLRVRVSAFVNHPTPSQLLLSLWSDPDVDGVFWKGHPIP